jgi:hypothetical protein
VVSAPATAQATPHQQSGGGSSNKIWIAVGVGLAIVGGVIAVVIATRGGDDAKTDDTKKTKVADTGDDTKVETDDDIEPGDDTTRPPEPKLPPAQWGVVWVHPQRLISVRFPQKPVENEQSTDSAIGKVHFTLAMHDGGDKGYMATAAIYDVPKGTPFDLEGALDGGRDEMLKNIGARPLSEKKISLDGFQGRELTFVGEVQGRTLHGTARLFASDSPPSAYIASAFRLSESADPDAQRFLDSMHLGTSVEK